MPFITGSEYVDADWVAGVWAGLLDVYRREVAAFDGTVELYFAGKDSDMRVPGRIFFHLVEDRAHDCFAFIATYSSDDEGRLEHRPLEHALRQYRGDTRRMLSLLSDLTTAAEGSTLISSLMESGELFHALRLTPDEAYQFLKEVPMYEESGIICRIPNWWRRGSRGQVSVEAQVGASGPKRFGAEALLEVEPVASLDGDPLTEDELRELLSLGNGLAFFKGKWVEVSEERLRRALEMFEGIRGMDGLTFAEAARLSAGIGGDDAVHVSNGAWLESMLQSMREGGAAEAEVPPSFSGKLRPYQARGVGWLSQLSSLGFGACLADDMGLGKTVQVIAFLESRRVSGGGRCLLVVPASLLGNWERELARFAPGMTVQTVHTGSGTDSGAHLTLTTYGMVRTREWIPATEWDTVVLDEAQAIKNASSQQAKAVKALEGRFRVAMTGTPVENRLSDLWSIFDFIDPGLLGTPTEFKAFVKALDDRPDGYARLREMTSPFILRRLKTDRRIIDDLPEKTEIDVPVPLSRKQAALYTDYQRRFEETLTASEGSDRRGVVLAAITKFKQICDHPDLFVGTGEFRERDSGKLVRLREIAETIMENGERMLVFTQYREMTGPLDDFLSGVFGRRGLVLHGGTPAKARTAMVERFNSESEYVPYMVLSLKAGGVGLNLTAANHVVHFDRWWNPAVENQATDRAFRIGQRRDVMVYRMVSEGTVEDRIAALIEEKRELAESVVGSGESWIAKMDDRELIDLFALR